MHVSDIIPIGWLHVAACLIALATGAWNLALAKGTPMHKRVGEAYILATLVANISVFWIYRFDIAQFVPFKGGPNTFGMFHWFAVAALVFIAIGWYAARHQDKAFWAYTHPTMMVLSYWNLVGGGINEVFTRVDFLRAIMVESAKASAAANGPPPVLGLVHMMSMAATIVLIIYFAARVALWRRKARRKAVPA
jgi:uncharacterized membrane protein